VLAAPRRGQAQRRAAAAQSLKRLLDVCGEFFIGVAAEKPRTSALAVDQESAGTRHGIAFGQLSVGDEDGIRDLVLFHEGHDDGGAVRVRATPRTVKPRSP